jgi:cystathionine gamma-lyase
MIQSLGANAHILSVNDVYGGTFRYMTKVAETGQGVETTFLDMESANTEEITAHIRPNTKVSIVTTVPECNKTDLSDS